MNAKTLPTIAACVLLAGCAARRTEHARLGPVVSDEILAAAEGAPQGGPLADAVKQGVRKLRRGRYEAAGKDFAAGLRLNPTDGNLHFLNALSFHLRSLSGDRSLLDQAEAGYALSLRFDKDNHWASYLLGHVYFEQKRYADAQNQFSYASLQDPENPVILRALAVASYYAGQPDLGRWAAERSLAGDPSSSTAWRAAALSRAALGDGAAARQGLSAYRERLGASPRAPFAYDSAARAVDSWLGFHGGRATLAQGVFGTASAPEGQVLDLGDKADNFDDTQLPGPPPATKPAAAKPGAPAASPAPATAPAAPQAPLPRMTLVDVVIIRTEENRSQSKGVNLLEGLKATLTGTLYAFNRVTGYSAGGADAGAMTHTIAPTLALAGLEYNLNIFNDGISKAEVLARPSLLAVDGKPSAFYSGSVLHVQLNSNLADGTVVDVPIGITLNVTPTFLDDETVNIAVHAERSFIESRDEKLGFTVFSQTAKTSVDATATLRFGETMVLSGLAEQETTRSKSGVPFLQSVPGVQYFFSNKTTGEFKTSVLVLISPNRHRYADGDITPERAAQQGAKTAPQTEHTRAARRRARLPVLSNIDATLAHLARSQSLREIRTGDLRLDEWHDSDSLFGAFKRALSFLYY